MNLFPDASVLLAASGSSTGSSRALFSFAEPNGWTLTTSPYAISEVERNLPRLPSGSDQDWRRLQAHLVLVDDVSTLDRPVVFPAAKDRPIDRVCQLK